MKTAYVANCNLPNHFAHAMQVMKNAQAWNRNSDEFQFVSNLTFFNWLRADREFLNNFYGISDPFEMKLYPFLGMTGKNWSPINELFYKKAANFLKDWGAELVFTRTFVLPKYSLDLGLPTIVETHGPPGTSQEKNDLYKRLGKDNFLGIVTISEPLKRMYVEHGLPEDKIFIAEDGADLSMFSENKSKHQARKDLGYPVDGQYALYVGHLYNDRGIKEIVMAARETPEVKFIIVGGHPGDVDLWRHKIEVQDIKNVEIVGFVNNSQVPDYLWMSDVLLMPYSRSCPTAEWMSPLKMFEYMAAARPIIATNLNAIQRILTHETSAYLVEPDDAVSLTSGIHTVLGDTDLQSKLGKNSHTTVQQFSWENRVKGIIEYAKAQ